MVKLYVSDNGNIGLSKPAIQLLDIEITNDSYVGIIQDKQDNSLFLYGSTATSEKPKRKLQYAPSNKMYYITVKKDLLEIFFENVVGSYVPMALEEESYNIDGIECFKVIFRE